MLYEKKYYEPTSYRDLVIDVLSDQHELLSIDVPSRSYWTRFDADYLEGIMVVLSQAVCKKLNKNN